MSQIYGDFFRHVTGKSVLPYQERYAEAPFTPTLLIVATGLGKSDAVLVPWLYGRAMNSPDTPTRLIIVLPRQNLTAQTAGKARERVAAADLGQRVKVLELMAGSGDNDQELRPNEPAIIVATQDLYFSRALNRGYARRPPRWPIDFALYNQDCQIVLDEIQLMDEALASSTQLTAFREIFGIFKSAPCTWMSATVNPTWLETVDFKTPLREIRLGKRDFEHGLVRKRIQAAKALAPAPPDCSAPEGCAAFALEQHRPGTRTLIIANTVPRAREIFAAVRKGFENAFLLHSRFRPPDRKTATSALLGDLAPEGQIVVATQVLEAGIDITARLLITDLAPWGSMVQRFGRVNRYGDDADAQIFWVERPTHAKQKNFTAPYEPEGLDRVAQRLQNLTSASPVDLPGEDGPEPYLHVLRRADLMDLFDTTPDLAGNEIDVSRFIRAGEDRNVYVAWREWDRGASPSTGRAELDELDDDELCPAPIGEFREFCRKRQVFAFHYATEEWVEIGRETAVYPGMLALARAAEGGYAVGEGWSPESKGAVPVNTHSAKPVDADTSDGLCFEKYRQTLRAHSDRVGEEMERLIADCGVEPRWAEALRTAAAKHDWGKAHEVFQETLHRNYPGSDLLAKQCGGGRHSRKHFRHELASALAMVSTGDSDLAAYLAASHHGKIRLNIRSMPGEQEKDGVAVARGIRAGDALPGCELAAGVHVAPVTLSLAVMEFGAEMGSWTDRMLRLRDEIGPFRMAYLEMLLRAADGEASAEPGAERVTCP